MPSVHQFATLNKVSANESNEVGLAHAASVVVSRRSAVDNVLSLDQDRIYFGQDFE